MRVSPIDTSVIHDIYQNASSIVRFVGLLSSFRVMKPISFYSVILDLISVKTLEARKKKKERPPTMSIPANYTTGVQNGQIVVQKNYTTDDAKEVKTDLTQQRNDIQADVQALTTAKTETTQALTEGRQDLTKGLENIQKLALPEINSALNLPATSTGGAEDEGGGDPGLTQQLFSQLFSGGENGNNLLKNFAGLASTLTGKSVEDVATVLDSAKGLFEDGKLNLENAAGFVAKALGLNEKAIGLIATAYTLLSNPFTAAGAAALFQQAMGLMNESKENKTQANTQQTTAEQRQQAAQQQAQLAQAKIQQTAAFQAQIAEAMKKLKDNQVLTKEQLEKLVKASEDLKKKQNLTKVNQPNINQTMKENTLQPVKLNSPTVVPTVAPNTEAPSLKPASFPQPAFSGTF